MKNTNSDLMCYESDVALFFTKFQVYDSMTTMMMMMLLPSRRQCSRCSVLWRKLLFILAFCAICILLHCDSIISSVGVRAQEVVVDDDNMIDALLDQKEMENDNTTEDTRQPENEDDDQPPLIEEEKQEPSSSSSSSSSLKVEKDYLDHLSTAALEKICLDRGFAVARQQNDTTTVAAPPLTRQDYLQAARRCLTLEDEINLILAEHPELAAELESEVERMRQQKERLEAERNELQAELRLLQSQLESAGVDIGNISASSFAKMDKTTSLKDMDPNNMTFEQVMRYTLTELFERVQGDVKFVWSLIRPVVAPLIPTVQKLYTSYGQPLAQRACKLMQQVVHMGVAEVKKRIVGDDNENYAAAGTLSAVASSPER
jgi:hypothetical protein